MAPNQSHSSSRGPSYSGIRKRKRNREAPYTTNGRPKKLAVNPIKSRIRDLERQLRREEDKAPASVRDKLPANVHVNHERELAALKSQLVDTEQEAKRQKLIKKYHMVRFFERKKAQKFLKKAEWRMNLARRTGADEDLQKEAEEKVRTAKVDLNYTLFTPLVWKYCALWPKERKGDGDAKEGEEGDSAVGGEASKAGETKVSNDGKEGESTPHGDPAMWERVRKATEEGQKALERLRDSTDWKSSEIGELIDITKEAKLKPKRKKAKSKSKKKAKIKADDKPAKIECNGPEEKDVESDGGFFE